MYSLFAEDRFFGTVLLDLAGSKDREMPETFARYWIKVSADHEIGTLMEIGPDRCAHLSIYVSLGDKVQDACGPHGQGADRDPVQRDPGAVAWLRHVGGTAEGADAVGGHCRACRCALRRHIRHRGSRPGRAAAFDRGDHVGRRRRARHAGGAGGRHLPGDAVSAGGFVGQRRLVAAGRGCRLRHPGLYRAERAVALAGPDGVQADGGRTS